MADLKTAMSQIANQIKFDDEDDLPEHKSKTKQLWEFIKSHPGSTAGYVATQLGLTPTRTATLLLQLWERGKLSRDGKPLAYSALHDTYEEKGTKNIQTSKTPVKQQSQPKPRPKFTPPVSLDIYDAATVLTNMNVVQARKVYDELKKVFG